MLSFRYAIGSALLCVTAPNARKADVNGNGNAVGGKLIMTDRLKGAVAGATAGLAGVSAAAAQDGGGVLDLFEELTGGDDVVAGDTAAAGNGGTASASASGGAVAIEDINSGGNTGNAVAAGDTYGDVAIDGGDVSATTDIGISADGGTAIADASGGDDNFAFVS